MHFMYSWSSQASRSTIFFNFCSVIKSREVFMRTVPKFLTKLSLDQKWICFISIHSFVKGICLKSDVPVLNKKQSCAKRIQFWLKCRNLKLKNVDFKLLTLRSCCLNALCLCSTCGLSLAAKWLGSQQMVAAGIPAGPCCIIRGRMDNDHGKCALARQPCQ